ncbi:MAG: hypothetical protein HY560_09620, partial [Gemmatimonadetes bacterium]|nr:hypothetical protein [Gemmatimonadota bacterium]
MQGAIGGLLAGAVVALWFLVVDLISGNPFLTPTVLGSVVFEQTFAYPSARTVLAYSVLHFAVFAGLGVFWVQFLQALRAEPGLLLGMVFGIVVLNAFHYSALLLGGVVAVLVLPPAHVLAANFLGGMVFMTYLHWVSRSAAPMGVAVLLHHPLLRSGVGVGLLG